MASDLPDYQDSVTVGHGPVPGISAIPLLSVPGLSGAPASTGAATALGALGGEIASVAKKLDDGIQHTKATQALSGFLDDNDRLTQQYLEDKDYATSEERFRGDIEAAKMSRLENIDDPQLRSRTELQMKRSSIEAAGTVRMSVATRQKDINLGALDQYESNALRRAVSAPSDTARIAVIEEYGGEVNRMHAAGWIDTRTAVARGQKFKQQLDTADAMAAIQKDPAAALLRLQDPKQFPGLDPVSRQSYTQAAIERADTNQLTAIVNRAPFDPVGAALTVGRVASPDQVRQIFDRGILKIENARGDVAAVSPAGALGLAQLMPGTARDTARRLGMADVAALSDADLEKRLLSDGPLNVQLGRAYFSQMATRYDGNVALAAAAYNAGPGNADRWKRDAEARFGVAFTPAQLASVVDFKETRDYLTKLYKGAAAPMDVGFSSPASMVRAVNGIGSVIDQQQRQEAHLLTAQASAVRQTDPVLDILQQGLNADPARIIDYRAKQQAAADRGDAAAAGAVRSLDQALQLHPYIQQAWKTAPVMLDGVVARLESEVAGSPNVTASMQHQLKAFKAVRDEVAKRRDSDPISLGERGGYYPAIAIDPRANPDDPAFRAALAQRGAQATTSAKVYLGSAAALKPEEALALKQRYDSGNADDKFRIVQAMAATLPERVYSDTLAQSAGNNSTTQFVGLIAQKRPQLAQEIFHGNALMETAGVKEKAADVRAAASSKLGGQLYVNPQQQNDVVQAATALYTARRAGGGLYDASDVGAIEKAIEDITGPIVKRNGVKTAAPPGMTAGQFHAVLDHLTDQSFDQFGGAYDQSGGRLSGDFLSSHAVLRQLAPGGSRYMVVVPQGRGGKDIPVWQASDPGAPPAPLIVDVSLMQPGAAPLSPYQRGRRYFRSEINDRIQQTRRDSEGTP
jgi:soluble lytic murein transglycosylase-like protein